MPRRIFSRCSSTVSRPSRMLAGRGRAVETRSAGCVGRGRLRAPASLGRNARPVRARSAAVGGGRPPSVGVSDWFGHLGLGGHDGLGLRRRRLVRHDGLGLVGRRLLVRWRLVRDRYVRGRDVDRHLLGPLDVVGRQLLRASSAGGGGSSGSMFCSDSPSVSSGDMPVSLTVTEACGRSDSLGRAGVLQRHIAVHRDLRSRTSSRLVRSTTAPRPVTGRQEGGGRSR